MERLQIAKQIKVTASEAIDKLYLYDTGSFVEVSQNFPSDIYLLPGDMIYIGSSSTFEKLYIDFELLSSAAIGNDGSGTEEVFTQYYDGSAFSNLTVTDNTEGFKQNNTITWTAPGDWASESIDTIYSETVDATSRYWIRIVLGVQMTSSTSSSISGTSLVVAGTPWTVNAYSKKFVVIESSNERKYILSNTNNTLTADSNFTASGAKAFTIFDSAFAFLQFKICYISTDSQYTYSETGVTPFIFDINPLEADMHPGRDQSIIQLAGGEVFVQEASGDSRLRTFTWRGLPETTYSTFINGVTEFGKFDKVYYYGTDANDSTLMAIYDQTYQSYTSNTTNIPFTTPSSDETTEVLLYSTDRLFFGLDSEFYGIAIDFEESAEKYYTDLIEDTYSTPEIKSITISLSPSGGDMDSPSATLSHTYDTTNDGTDMFTHDGQIIWTSSDVGSWTSVSMDTILSATSSLTAPDDFFDPIARYWAMVQVTYVTGTSGTVKIQDLRTKLDSLDYLSFKYSDGRIPIWWVYTPDNVSSIKPANYRDDDWFPIKVVDYTKVMSNTAVKWWDIILTFVVPGRKEVRRPIKLDGNVPRDSKGFYSRSYT